MSADYFAVFNLPAQFDVDEAQLNARYRALLLNVHPDRFVNASATDKRLSLQHTTEINFAYETLKKPLSRLLHLLERHGISFADEGASDAPSRRVSPGFLMAQMEWREALADATAAKDQQKLAQLAQRLSDEIAESYQNARIALESNELLSASEIAQQLRFQEKLNVEIRSALHNA